MKLAANKLLFLLLLTELLYRTSPVKMTSKSALALGKTTTSTKLVLNTEKVYEGLIKKYELSINQVRLGNYLKKLLLENNKVVDKNVIFINQEDIDLITKDEINYDLQLDEKDIDELRARLFAFLWSKKNGQSGNGASNTPYSVKEDTKGENPKWKNFIVLMTNGNISGDLDKLNNSLLRVCFPKEAQENFAIVVDSEKSCKEKMDKIDSFRILTYDMETKEAKEKEAKFKELMGETEKPDTSKLSKLEKKEKKKLELKRRFLKQMKKRMLRLKKKMKDKKMKKNQNKASLGNKNLDKELDALKIIYKSQDKALNMIHTNNSNSLGFNRQASSS